MLVITVLFGTSYAAPNNQSGKLTVLTSNSPFFSEVDSRGEVSGYTVSLVKNVLATAGIEAEFEALPFANLVHELDNRQSGVVAVLARTPQRENDYYWITPITANPVALFVKSTSAYVKQQRLSLSDISRISVLSGDYREEILQQHEVKQIVSTDSWAEAIRMTLAGETDGVFFSQMGLALVCKQQQLNCAELVKVLLWNTAYSYMVLPKAPGNLELAATLTVAASEYKTSADYRKLIKRTVPELKKHLPDVNVEEGIISFADDKQLASIQDLWVIADLVPHFVEADIRGHIVGYLPDLVRKILNEAGYEQQILTAPWERIVKEAENKSNVLAFAVARTPDREDMFHWLTPVTRNMHALFGTDGKTYEALSEIPNNKKIATLRLDYRSQVSKEAGLTTIEFDSWAAAMAAIFNGEADYIFGSQGAVQLACKDLRKACRQVKLVMPHRYVTTYIVLSKTGTRPELVERLKNASVVVKQSDEYKRWAQQWSENMRVKQGLEQHVKDGVVNLWRADQ